MEVEQISFQQNKSNTNNPLLAVKLTKKLSNRITWWWKEQQQEETQVSFIYRPKTQKISNPKIKLNTFNEKQLMIKMINNLNIKSDFHLF